MFRTLGGQGKDKETIKINDPFDTNFDLITTVKEIYEKKVVRNMYVIEVLEILKESEWYIGKDNNRSETLCDIEFLCEIDCPEKNDILVNCVCQKGGRANDVIILEKGNMTIMANCNPNIDQVLINQVLTLKIKCINWEPNAIKINVVGSFNHAHIFMAKVYSLDPNVAMEHKRQIKIYLKTIQELLTTPLTQKFVDLSYPFTKHQQPKLDSFEIIPIIDLLKRLIKSGDGTDRSRITNRLVVVRNAFCPPGEVLSFKVHRKAIPKKMDTMSCLAEMYDEYIKYIKVIREMDTYYETMPTNLLDFYTASKCTNDRFINRLNTGLSLLVTPKKD